MATLNQLVANSLWFAFDALDFPKAGVVPKSQLKVLTQNIGVLLNVGRRVENCITDYLSTKQLTYEQYLDFLTREVLVEVDDGKTAYGQLKPHHDALERAFWILGRASFIQRTNVVFSDDSAFKIFRIFCLFADRTSPRKGTTQITLSISEVYFVTQSLVLNLGREWDEDDFVKVAAYIPNFTFPVFLTYLEGHYVHDVESPALHSAVDALYDTYVQQIVKKGKLYQRAWWGPAWFLRNMEVVPWALQVSWPLKETLNLPKQLALKAQQAIEAWVIHPPVALCPTATVENVPDEPDNQRTCRMKLSAESNKIVYLAATDHRNKTEWIRALEAATEHAYSPLPHQLVLSRNRKSQQIEMSDRDVADRVRRYSQADIIEKTQAELEQEKLARAEAEEIAKSATSAKVEEEKRVIQLETLHDQLQQLLEQEKQAKRDEELVRQLQTRVLREEWQRREELEKIQEDSKKMLDAETKKRIAFERIQEEKESQLKEAERRLRELEKDRMRLDHELRTAREKIVLSERGMELIEARMSVTENPTPLRTFSFRPSKGEPKTAPPMRASSFNTHMPRLLNKLRASKTKERTPPDQSASPNAQ